MVTCEDCGKLYSSEDWVDCILSDDQWLLIHPESKEGILCGSCMIKRISKLPNVTVIKMIVE